LDTFWLANLALGTLVSELSPCLSTVSTSPSLTTVPPVPSPNRTLSPAYTLELADKNTPEMNCDTRSLLARLNASVPTDPSVSRPLSATPIRMLSQSSSSRDTSPTLTAVKVLLSRSRRPLWTAWGATLKIRHRAAVLNLRNVRRPHAAYATLLNTVGTCHLEGNANPSDVRATHRTSTPYTARATLASPDATSAA
jgi:hypothetical protein